MYNFPNTIQSRTWNAQPNLETPVIEEKPDAEDKNIQQEDNNQNESMIDTTCTKKQLEKDSFESFCALSKRITKQQNDQMVVRGKY